MKWSLLAASMVAFGSVVCDGKAQNSSTAQKDEAAPVSALAPGEGLLLTAADGVRIYGTYRAAAQPHALILLFHQAGSSSGEYETIAPRLLAKGYSSLAIDQRSGGTLFGPNKTVNLLGRSSDYLAARADLDAALAWAKQRNLPIILWGSSYSSALVFLLAADNPDSIRAVLSFSPGEYLDGVSVRKAAARVHVPLFVATTLSERSEARPIFEAAGTTEKAFFVPPTKGMHGSSTLIEARNPSGAKENMAAVLNFLKEVTTKPVPK